MKLQAAHTESAPIFLDSQKSILAGRCEALEAQRCGPDNVNCHAPSKPW